MRSVPAFALLLVLVACGSEDGSGRARDPAGPSSVSRRPPVAVPDGPVRTRVPVTVMDDGRPELCLGAIAESWPPQCSGPEITGWDWAAHEGSFEQHGEVRWGEFGLTGRWDGTTFTVVRAVPGGRSGVPAAPPVPPPVLEGPGSGLDEARLSSITERLRREVVGVQHLSSTAGRVHLGVTYDDGSLQEWADEELGAGTVVVTAALVDVGSG